MHVPATAYCYLLYTNTVSGLMSGRHAALLAQVSGIVLSNYIKQQMQKQNYSNDLDLSYIITRFVGLHMGKYALYGVLLVEVYCMLASYKEWCLC